MINFFICLVLTEFAIAIGYNRRLASNIIDIVMTRYSMTSTGQYTS